MTTTTMTTRRVRGALGLLAGCAGLLLLAAPAQAQVCGDLEDLNEDLLDLYADELDDEWGVDLGEEQFCNKVTQNFVKACQSAVKETVKCIRTQILAIGKMNKEGCKTFAGDDSKACSDFFKQETDDAQDELAADAELRDEDCEFDQGEEFFDICFFGFP